ncbi:MAG: AMIN domain-containing protein [Myxococcaceae bacterium]
MRTLRIGLVAACLLPLLAAAQDRTGLNTISQVIVRPGVVEIIGSSRPNFTTFTMANPHRLVIDISDAELKGVPAVIEGQAMITGVKTASYGSGPGAIARVLIGFEREIDTDIIASGSTLRVKVLQPEKGTGYFSDARNPDGSARATQVAAVQPELDRTESTNADRNEAEARARRTAEGEAQRRTAEAEAQHRAEAEAQRRAAEAEAQRKAEVETQRRAEEAEARRRAAEVEAQRRAAEAEAQHRAAEAEARRRAENEAQHRADEIAAQRGADEAEARRAREAAERDDSARVEAQREERLRREEARRVEAEAKRRSELEARRSRTQPAVAREGQRSVSLVGFRPSGRGARVFIQMDGTTQYEVREGDVRTIVVVLRGTRISSPNNARFLDTSFFDTPVQLVNPTEVGDEVHVAVKLKRPVPYQVHQSEDALVIEFQER